MEQRVLPLHDMPSDRPEPKQRPARIGLSSQRSAKVADYRLTVALADPARVLFLDVETTGLSWFYDQLTMVGWACDGEYHRYIAGDDPHYLLQALRTAQTLVT